MNEKTQISNYFDMWAHIKCKFKRPVIVEKPKKSEWLKKREKRDRLKRNQSLTLLVAASSSFVSAFLSIFFNLQIQMGFVEDPT